MLSSAKRRKQKNGNTVNVRYCLYDNGSKTDADGNSCEELVLEKSISGWQLRDRIGRFLSGKCRYDAGDRRTEEYVVK